MHLALVLAVLASFWLTPSVEAACTGTPGSGTLNSSLDQVSVQQCISNALDGDTIHVAAGNQTWTGSVPISGKQINVIGAGIGNSNVTDGMSLTDSGIRISGSKNVRLSGFTFIGGTGMRGPEQGTVRVDGTMTGFRIDHNEFRSVSRVGIFVRGCAYGVVDNNQFKVKSAYSGTYALNIYHSTCDSSLAGHGSFALPSALGTAQAVYVEDNTFTQFPPAAVTQQVNDAHTGARMVFRFNDVTDLNFSSHGTDSTGGGVGGVRGLRTFEIYANKMQRTISPSNNAMHARSGVGVMWGNTIDDASASVLIQLTTYRKYDSFGNWGGCDGKKGYDNNLNGGAPYATGTISSVTTKTTIHVSPSPGWTDDEWVDATLNVANSSGDDKFITSNDADSITTTSLEFSPVNDDPLQVNYIAGETFAIRRAYPCHDQVGWGGGVKMVVGAGGTASTPSTWLAIGQRIEPLYFWGNIGEDTVQTVTPDIKHGREVYAEGNNNGVVQGTGAVPGSCTNGPSVPRSVGGVLSSEIAPGQGFWKSNEGTWNQGTAEDTLYKSHYTGQGRLYRCIGSVFVPYYTPYTYPHPIRTGTFVPPTCPPDCIVVPPDPVPGGRGRFRF